MVAPILLLVVVAFALAVPLTVYARSMGHRLAALDGAGVAGQVKEGARRVPNTGGVAVFGAVTLPLVVFLVGMRLGLDRSVVEWVPALAEHLDRVRDQAGAYGWLLICLAVLHVMGLIDDRRPLGAMPKLLVMLVCATVFVVASDTRVLTLLDAHAGGRWLSVLVTVVWIVAVTNAMNFIDNMDGLCGGVGAIAGACFMAGALVHRQWFVAGVLALLVGACLGFLVFNFPWRRPATIFLGDGGSLVVGFVLATMAVRITYAWIDAGEGPAEAVRDAGRWHAVLTPFVVLAVPLYDMLSVTFLRLKQGKSPFVGDLQHLSHRLHFGGLSRDGKGLTKRDTVVVICGLTAITGCGGVILPALAPWQGLVVFAQTVAALTLLGVWEYRASAAARGEVR
ncbi:MAG: undecaprenyl/decaprenyl-phosphate alpha-N-acetylglucosaminyl 1-phosphate transferase [Phycisphaerales bacterium]|nr:undecaprenyl/decaprenyl-phosphate alpha-N-acetylglucosaminyl 1-phosphate transferase [Phycisphaerales bacterium]